MNNGFKSLLGLAISCAVGSSYAQTADSIKLAVQGGGPAITTTNTTGTTATTLQLNSTVYPGTLSQGTTWAVMTGGTASGSISTAGLLTANTDGTVLAKATSVQDITKSDSLLITITGQTNIADLSNDLGITVYPNPAKNHVLLKAAAHPAMTLAIYNANGQQMSTHSVAENQLQNTYRIDISNYIAGLYLIRFHTATQQQNLLFTVEQ